MSGSFEAWRISDEFETFQEQGRQSPWVVHVAAWQRSGLTRTEYCRVHRLAKDTLDRWLKDFAGDDATRKQAFWARRVEAMNGSGMGDREYAAALQLSPYSLRRWRDRGGPLPPASFAKGWPVSLGAR